MDTKVIEVTHRNGYSGKLYGKTSMSIFKDGEEVMHTGRRTVNTEDGLRILLGEMPHLLAILNEVDGKR